MPHTEQTLLFGVVVLICTVLLGSVYCKLFHKYFTVFDADLGRRDSRAESFTRRLSGGGAEAAAAGGGGEGGGGDDGGGLAASAINLISSCEYGKLIISGRLAEVGVWAKECSICLGAFDLQDIVRLMPSCHHLFHLPCIDAWLLSRPVCPLCRRLVLPYEKPCHVMTTP